MIPTVTTIKATGTYTSPPGCKYIKVYTIGGGGGGGGGGPGSSQQGSGGGSGRVLLRYFDAGTYSVIRGAGGSGGAVGLGGSAGGTSVFGGVVAAAGGGGGVVGGTSSYGGTITSTGTLFQGSAPGQAGASDINTSGNGGTNMFSRGGSGCYALNTDTIGFLGLTFGGGGSGGCGVTSPGGGGAAGGMIVIEYY